jgi:hypothetical protein
MMIRKRVGAPLSLKLKRNGQTVALRATSSAADVA